MVDPPPTDEEYVNEAVRIVEHMANNGIPVRIMAGCAVRIHCPNHLELHKNKMQRNIRDIDLVALSNHKKEIDRHFKDLGYSEELAMFSIDRDIYHSNKTNITVDIFFDKLEMCHTIDLRKRLENDYPTLALADLLLQKLQIVEVNERDLKDIIVMILEHGIGETDKETVDSKYLARLLCDDWGFYYTATNNLRETANILKERYGGVVGAEHAQIAQFSIEQLLSNIEREPKSLKWRMRQRVGTKMIWYKEVEEKERGRLAEYLIKKNREAGLGSKS